MTEDGTKVIVVGAAGSGKTSLVTRCVIDESTSPSFRISIHPFSRRSWPYADLITITRLVGGTFSPEYMQTFGAELFVKTFLEKYAVSCPFCVLI